MPRKRWRHGGLIGVVGAIGQGSAPAATSPRGRDLTPSMIHDRRRSSSVVCAECFGPKSQYSPWFCARCEHALFGGGALAASAMASFLLGQRQILSRRRNKGLEPPEPPEPPEST
jgi:hypothetical protein